MRRGAPVTHPAVRDLFHTLSRHEAFQELIGKLVRREPGPFALSGLTPAAKALYLVLAWQATEKPMLVLADGNQRAELLTELCEAFFGLLIGRPELGHPQLLPAWDVLPGQKLSPHTEIAEQRAIGLWRLSTGAAPITIAPVGSALLRIHDAAYYRRLALDLRVGEELPLDSIEAHLQSIGYTRRDPVEMLGEYSVRGGILDVFGAETARPLRVEFFGDEIESIRRFEVESQRSVMKISEAQILPLAEQPRTGDFPPRRPAGSSPLRLTEPRPQSILDLATDAAVIPTVIIDEPEQLRSASERLWKRLEQHPNRPKSQKQISYHWETFARTAQQRTRCSNCASWISIPLPAHRHAPVARLPRQHAGGRGRSAHHGRARLSRRFLRAHRTASWNAWPTSCANIPCPSNSASRPMKLPRRIWPSARISPGRSPARI